MKKKKNEFKKDKLEAPWLSRLYLTQKQRRAFYTWALMALLLLVISVLQDVVLCRLRIYDAATDLVPCVIFLIAIIEGSQNGSVFALCAGMFYQFSGSAPGGYTLVLITAIAIGAAIFRQSYLQKSFGAALLTTGLAVFAYELLNFTLGWATGLTVFSRLPGFLITAVLTLVAVPLLYPVVLSIAAIGGDIWKE